MRIHRKMLSVIQKDQGYFQGGSGVDADAGRLYKMDRSWSSEEYR